MTVFFNRGPLLIWYSGLRLHELHNYAAALWLEHCNIGQQHKDQRYGYSS